MSKYIFVLLLYLTFYMHIRSQLLILYKQCSVINLGLLFTMFVSVPGVHNLKCYYIIHLSREGKWTMRCVNTFWSEVKVQALLPVNGVILKICFVYSTKLYFWLTVSSKQVTYCGNIVFISFFFLRIWIFTKGLSP